MEIKYIGQSSFVIEHQKTKIITDPFSPAIGFTMPSLEAQIITLSHAHEDHNFVEAIGGDPIVFDTPGEYEKDTIRITGFASFHDKENGAERGKNTIFKFEIGELSILHLGDLGHTLTEGLCEEIGNVNVLLIPVGGHFTINADEAAKVIAKLEPNIVIPMHFRTALHSDSFALVAPIEDFLKKMGKSDQETTKSLKVENATLTEDTQIVLLEQLAN